MAHSTIPDQIEAPKLNDYLEVMTRAVFQAGLSWASIAQRWEAFRTAFDGFDARRVAAYTEGDIDQMALYAGQSVGMVDSIEAASEIVKQIAREALDVIQHRLDRDATP